MKFKKTNIPEIIIIEPHVLGDSRGYFTETFRQDLFEDFIGYPVNFCQENESKSHYGVVRGLHYQLPPYSQSKLVRVILGSVMDVAVDIRYGSPTFGHSVSVELSGENKRQLYIPRGFAHGFSVLSKEVIFSYKVDNYYSPEYDRGIKYDDHVIDSDWNIPIQDRLLSPKDLQHPLLKDADLFEYGINFYD
jgi:dTDP-4-dehydrorhamnose 3,5-epimerase